MSFIERAKKVLLERNSRELSNIEQSIEEITRMHFGEHENVQRLKGEFEIANKEKSRVQKSILDKKDIEELKTIYDFVANYETIQKVLKIIKDIKLREINKDFIYFENEFDLRNAEMSRRNELYEVVRKLNAEITQVINEEKDSIPKEEPEIEEKGFWAKLFGNRKKEIKNDKKAFKKFRKTILEFKQKYNSFLIADFVEFDIIDRAESIGIARAIHQLSIIKNRGDELYPEDEQFLEECKPHELWKEIAEYYNNISGITNIIEKFDSSFDKYQQLYEEKPELFDLNNLARIFRENNQKIVALKDRNKEATDKKKEVLQQRKSERELKEKLRNLEEKQKKLIEKREQIKKSETLNALGFKNKEDAVRKLGLETKDYVVIPVQNSISKISDLFEDERTIRVEVEGRTFFQMYSNEVVVARINSIESEKNTNSCLMIPIFELRKEDIDSIRAGKIFLNKSILELSNILFIAPEGRTINFEGAEVETQHYSHGSILEQMKIFFGEDFLTESNGISDYDIFKGIPNVSSREKKSKREAVKKCVLENVKRDIESTDSILVNGKPYYLNKNDEKDIRTDRRIQPLNEKFLIEISDEIENYLIEGDDKGTTIDQLYAKLLLEYMRIDRKSKADYYDEDNTTISIKDRKISIKPILPAKDEKIAKRYSRTSEDVVYKTMKLAGLINKFAHLATSKELQDTLYGVKLDLIERTIDLAKNNPKVNLKRKFDDDKMVMSVVLEIPGYNMIALHIMNKSNELTHKSNRLEECGEDVLQTSAILIPGVNKDFLNIMINMTERDRMDMLINLDSATFSKLVLRMGYTSDKVSTEEKRKEFIKMIISDKMIAELLRENEEIER